MKPIPHATGRWVVFIPAKNSSTGRRQSKYFLSKNAALEEISRLKAAWHQFGSATFTADERHYLAIARQELAGDLSRLPEVLRHWRLTGPDSITKITVRDAIGKYLENRASQDIARKTIKDTRSALRYFPMPTASYRWLHEVTAADVRAFIDEHEGSGRRAMYKQVKLFLDWAEAEKLIGVNVIHAIKAPKVQLSEVEVYRPEQYKALLETAERSYRDLVPFLVLSGFGMMRTGELCHADVTHPTLRWENILYERSIVHVPEAVAKQTRRAAGNRREFPLNDALRHWLEPHRRAEGPIVDGSESSFRSRITELFKAASVRRIHNALRKSAISYWIGKNPESGVVTAARFAGNSEATSRRHYVAWITQEAGEAWYAIRRAS
jgi:integrase